MRNSIDSMRWAAVVATAALAVPVHDRQAQPRAEFTALFDGTLSGWTVENTTADNFATLDGVLRVDGAPGWLKSMRQYADFDLLVEFRFLTENGDSGIFVRAQPDATFGPGWPSRSYQLQLLNPNIESRFPPVGAVFRHGMPAGETEFDPEVARRAFTGVGEWQTLELSVIGERLTAALNGVPLTSAGGIANATGYIGIQGETSALEFRRIEIRER